VFPEGFISNAKQHNYIHTGILYIGTVVFIYARLCFFSKKITIKYFMDEMQKDSYIISIVDLQKPPEAQTYYDGSNRV